MTGHAGGYDAERRRARIALKRGALQSLSVTIANACGGKLLRRLGQDWATSGASVLTRSASRPPENPEAETMVPMHRSEHANLRVDGPDNVIAEPRVRA